SCGAYVCGNGSCLKICVGNADCSSGNFCSNGSCVPQEANGAACGGAGACQSGFCVDGVCCENACNGTCMTCNGVGTQGTCTAQVSGTDLHNECTATASTSCGNDGTCDGAGACRNWGVGTPCGSASCSGATLLPVPTCNGSGSCLAGTPSSCGTYQCNTTGASCKNSCTADTDCTQNFQGPAYALPTGAGQYNISAWGMQNTDPTFTHGAMQLVLNCAVPSASHFPVVGNFGVSMPSGVWTKISGTVDLTATAGCDPSTTGGVVD